MRLLGNEQYGRVRSGAVVIRIWGRGLQGLSLHLGTGGAWKGNFWTVEMMIFLPPSMNSRKPFRWTASAKSILDKVNRCREIINSED